MESKYWINSAGWSGNTTIMEVTSSPSSHDFRNSSHPGVGTHTQYSSTVLASIDRYYMWVILVVGFPGNVGSIITITKMSKLRSSTFYVAALATVDNVCLILKSVYMELKYQPYVFSDGGCKFMSLFGLMTAAFSNWILVAMATERYLAVRIPLKVANLWTLRRAVILTAVIFTILFALHMHLLWTIVTAEFGCGYAPQYTHFTDVYWYWISASVYAFIPCSVLIMFNVLIVYHIQQSSRVRRRMTVDTNPAKRSSANIDNHITMMLVTITIVFVILTIPRCVVILVINGIPATEEDQVGRTILNVITSVLADSNHAINFYLYFIAAKQFRYHFFKLILGRSRSRPYGSTHSRPTMTSMDDEHLRDNVRSTHV